jgi:hypothetical protein
MGSKTRGAVPRAQETEVLRAALQGLLLQASQGAPRCPCGKPATRYLVVGSWRYCRMCAKNLNPGDYREDRDAVKLWKAIKHAQEVCKR